MLYALRVGRWVGGWVGYLFHGVLACLHTHLEGVGEGRPPPTGHGLQTVLGHGDGAGGWEEDLERWVGGWVGWKEENELATVS